MLAQPLVGAVVVVIEAVERPTPRKMLPILPLLRVRPVMEEAVLVAAAET